MNWFGAETTMRLPGGLLTRSLSEIFSFMSANGFNALRFFFSLQNIAENQRTPPRFDEHGSPSLVGTDYIEMIAAVVKEAAQHGIVVLLANHQIKNGYPDHWPGSWDGNWFDDTYQPELILELWTRLALPLCTDDYWNIMGVEYACIAA